ncbi:MAG: hypothetical protein AAFV88_16850 [Planctomycetota bacterium]
MKTKLIRWITSLLVDEWPMPNGIRRRLEQHPQIAKSLARVRKLEAQLRDGAESSASNRIELAKCTPSAISHPHRHPRRSHRVWFSAAAAALLMIGSGMLWMNRDNEEPIATPEPVAQAADIRPVLASVVATKMVAKNVSDGFRDVAGKLTEASNRLGSQFSLARLKSTVSSFKSESNTNNE